jgi:hypothetical protein
LAVVTLQKDCPVTAGAAGIMTPVVTGEPANQLDVVPVKAKLVNVPSEPVVALKVVIIPFAPASRPWLNL